MSDPAPSQPSPRIYVAHLSDYNAGYLHGVWIDATNDVEDIQASITQMLVAGHDPNGEEWAIHDYEGFCGIRLGEYEPLAWVAGVASGVAKHGEAFAMWVERFEPNEHELGEFEDVYVGRWDTMADYARSLLDDFGEEVDDVGPEHLRPYFSFDIEAYARDLASEGHIVQGPKGVYVFSVS